MLGDTIFSPEIFALITARKKVRKKRGVRLMEMPNESKGAREEGKLHARDI